MVNLLRYNLHWREGFRYGYDKKRNLYHELIKHVDTRPVLGVVGLRRTGKTVLLKQLIDYLIEEGHPRDRIIYFSFDEEVASIHEVIKEFISRTGKELQELGMVHVFLDEIQKLEGWQNQVKYYYDTHPNLKFYVSGSSSLFLKKRAEESLAGRIFLFELPVLSFGEFLCFKGKNDMVEKPEMFREALADEVELYAKRQLPELVTADQSFVEMYVGSIISKVIYEDLPKIFPIEYEDALERILRIVASNPGLVTDYRGLAGDLGISRKTLSNYVSYLEKGFLIRKHYNFSRNLLTSEKKMKKLYLTNTTFQFALGRAPEFSRVVENLVVSSSGSRFFWRRGNFEVDAVLLRDEGITPVESKYKDNIRDRELKGLLKFMDEFSVDKGLVVSKDLDTERGIKGRYIKFIPLWRWLMETTPWRTTSASALKQIFRSN
ncbi:MAG: ATP-binding protein [Candidatus Hydrothermarchaeales archaeon]